MRRFVLAIALTVTATTLFAGESSAFFRKKKASVPVVTYAAPACDTTVGSPAYGSSYGSPAYGSSYAAPNYGSTSGYGYDSTGSTGLLGTVSGVGSNVVGGAANVLTAPFRMIR